MQCTVSGVPGRWQLKDLSNNLGGTLSENNGSEVTNKCNPSI